MCSLEPNHESWAALPALPRHWAFQALLLLAYIQGCSENAEVLLPCVPTTLTDSFIYHFIQLHNQYIKPIMLDFTMPRKTAKLEDISWYPRGKIKLHLYTRLLQVTMRGWAADHGNHKVKTLPSAKTYSTFPQPGIFLMQYHHDHVCLPHVLPWVPFSGEKLKTWRCGILLFFLSCKTSLRASFAVAELQCYKGKYLLSRMQCYLIVWISSQQVGGNVPSCLDKNIKWLGNKELGKAVDKVHAWETQGNIRLSH